jgi:hypothetical protein
MAVMVLTPPPVSVAEEVAEQEAMAGVGRVVLREQVEQDCRGIMEPYLNTAEEVREAVTLRV